MNTFLINLDRSPDRLTHMQAQLAALDIKAERVSAVDGRDRVPAHLRSQFATSTNLTSAEVGCYASHLAVMEIIRDRQLPHAVVLEDDANLQPDFVAATTEAIAMAPHRWDI